MQGPMTFPPLEEAPQCSIIIPCLNEAPHLETVLRAAMEQRYPRELFEILVADGGSDDGSRDIVARLAEEDPRVVLIDNPERFQSAGLNAAIRRARGKVIVRMDAHADYADTYVEASIAVLRRTGAANAGGAARPRYKTAFQQALCAALGSPLGVGGSAYRDPSREGFVESVWGGAYRREAFEQVGLFDGEARANEDAELNQRIIEAGGTIYLSREIISYYYPRSSLAALARQYFVYGQGRARTLLKRGKLLSIRPLVPFMLVTGLGFLVALTLALPQWWPLLAAALMMYAAGVVLESLRVVFPPGSLGTTEPAARKERLAVFARLLVIFPTMHLAHGLGVWKGLLLHAVRGLPRGEPERLAES